MSARELASLAPRKRARPHADLLSQTADAYGQPSAAFTASYQGAQFWYNKMKAELDAAKKADASARAPIQKVAARARHGLGEGASSSSPA